MPTLNVDPARTLFPDWVESRKADEIYPQQIREMWGLYGKAEGKTCGTCANCVHTGRKSHGYYRCKLTKWTHGPGSDWRLKWPACKKWEGKSE